MFRTVTLCTGFEDNEMFEDGVFRNKSIRIVHNNERTKFWRSQNHWFSLTEKISQPHETRTHRYRADVFLFPSRGQCLSTFMIKYPVYPAKKHVSINTQSGQGVIVRGV